MIPLSPIVLHTSSFWQHWSSRSSPGIESAEKKDDKSHDTLGVPPLYLPGGNGGGWCTRRGGGVTDQLKKARVTLTIWKWETEDNAPWEI